MSINEPIGGDKYKHISDINGIEWVIYVPQDISRPNKSEPRAMINITIN